MKRNKKTIEKELRLTEKAIYALVVIKDFSTEDIQLFINKLFKQQVELKYELRLMARTV